MTSIREKVRKAMIHALIGMCDRRPCTTRSANLGYSTDGIGSEYNQAVPVPSAAAPVGSIADCLQILSVGLNPLELAIREKANTAAVLGPEWVLCSGGALKWQAPR